MGNIECNYGFNITRSSHKGYNSKDNIRGTHEEIDESTHKRENIHYPKSR